MSKVTIRDVSRRAGVSTTTVSYVLNGIQINRISAETRQRVLQAAAELGYEPNAHARNLVSKKTRTICIVMPRSTTESLVQPYLTQLLRAVSRVADAMDYHLLLAGFGKDRDIRVKRLFQQSLTDKFLVVGTEFQTTTLEWMAHRGARLALLNNQHLNGPGIWSGLIDNTAGAYQAVRHLMNLGHTRIAILLGDADKEDLDLRLAGYKQALSGANLPFDKELVSFCEDRDSLETQIQRLLNMDNRPTAIFASTDFLAIEALSLLKKYRIRVPRDMALVGFDDAEQSAYQDPPLTTVRQPIEEMGIAAANFLMEDNGPSQVRKMFPVELIIRSSCGFYAV